MSNLSDIKRINKSLEEADSGFVLSFPVPPSGSVKLLDSYKFDFDVANRLPSNPLAEVIFTPYLNENNKSRASYLSNSINSNPNIGVSIKSIHKAETQTLLRLQIKSLSNVVLYTDYILVVASPQKILQLRGEILSRISGSQESIGPNGGRILRLNTLETTADLVSQLLLRMKVKGPGIPENLDTFIGSFIEDSSNDIELLPYFEIANEFNSGFSARGTYTFTITSSCISGEDLQELAFNNSYIILDSTNNWSFSFRDRNIAQFIPNTGLFGYSDIAILLDIKNFEALANENRALPIPAVGYLYGAGRVDNDTVCLNSI